MMPFLALGAVAFDLFTTKRALDVGGRETNPLLRSGMRGAIVVNVIFLVSMLIITHGLGPHAWRVAWGAFSGVHVLAGLWNLYQLRKGA